MALPPHKRFARPIPGATRRPAPAPGPGTPSAQEVALRELAEKHAHERRAKFKRHLPLLVLLALFIGLAGVEGPFRWGVFLSKLNPYWSDWWESGKIPPSGVVDVKPPEQERTQAQEESASGHLSPPLKAQESLRLKPKSLGGILSADEAQDIPEPRDQNSAAIDWKDIGEFQTFHLEDRLGATPSYGGGGPGQGIPQYLVPSAEVGFALTGDGADTLGSLASDLWAVLSDKKGDRAVIPGSRSWEIPDGEVETPMPELQPTPQQLARMASSGALAQLLQAQQMSYSGAVKCSFCSTEAKVTSDRATYFGERPQ